MCPKRGAKSTFNRNWNQIVEWQKYPYKNHWCKGNASGNDFQLIPQSDYFLSVFFFFLVQF